MSPAIRTKKPKVRKVRGGPGAGKKTVTVRAENGSLHVVWFCGGHYSFTPGDARLFTRYVDLASHNADDLQLNLRDESARSFHLKLKDGLLFANDYLVPEGATDNVRWDALKKAVLASLQELPATEEEGDSIE